MTRRYFLTHITQAAALVGSGALGARLARADDKTGEAVARAARGSAPLKITKVRPILTAPQGIRLLVVKVETSEPGLYGLGCGTFQQRPLAVKAAVEDYLDPFCRGRDADNIEDLWQAAYTSSYWRKGPVLNNALSGVDMALWDIKGKRAGMPVYQLLGGKCRFAVDCYTHSSGRDLKELEDSVAQNKEKGFRNIRIQVGGYGSTHLSTKPDFKDAGFGGPNDSYMDARPYLQITPKAFEHIRNKFGEELGLLHDVHERVEAIDAVNLCKELEKYHPFFVEDPLSPEQIGYFKQIRQQCATPLAMGELFNNPHEWVQLIPERLIDFIRVHLSQVGGLTPARKIATLSETFGVRSAWHGPGDVSPVGHACNIHLDLAIPNFGIQESIAFRDTTREVFPGAPTIKNGYFYVSEGPGWGVDINEELATKYPYPDRPAYWEPVRRKDGTSIRP